MCFLRFLIGKFVCVYFTLLCQQLEQPCCSCQQLRSFDILAPYKLAYYYYYYYYYTDFTICNMLLFIAIFGE